MVFEMNGQVHRLWFSHSNPAALPSVEEGDFLGTIAMIQVKDGDKWLCVQDGYAFLHPLDYKKYDKETGRKIALTRLLYKLYPDDRDQRRLVWGVYLNRNTPATQEPIPA